MAKVKIQGNASGTGVLTVTAPNTSTDRTVTLPDATGTLINTAPSTSGNILTSDGTDWTSAAAAGGLYASVAVICDQKAYNVAGGTATTGAWRTRDLNTEVSDADGIVSISSNQFTLQAGTYTIDWQAPNYKCDEFGSRLYNSTDGVVEVYGSSGRVGSTIGSTGESSGCDVVTITGAKVFEIQMRVATTKTDNGFGLDIAVDSTAVSIYTIVKILKHS